MDLINRKFTFTLPNLVAILSVISTLIGGYWYFKNTIENTKSEIISANENYKELKEEIYFLREQIYEIAIIYNKSVKMDDITNKSKKHFREPIEIDGTEVQNINETFKTGSIRLKSLDTIDISKIKRIKKSNPSNKKQ
jgi:hypothetical protein